MQEEELIQLSKNGDSKAMEQLYKVYAPRMRAICFRYVRSVFEVDDILQEAFVKVFMRLTSYSSKGSFEGWIRRIVVNTAINHYHSNINFLHQVPVEEIGDKEVEAVEIAEKISVEEIQEAINKMPPGYKYIFNMFAVDGYSHKEIAETLNISESTSRSQYARARKYLINLLTSYDIIKNV